jgi:hypothetical protein
VLCGIADGWVRQQTGHGRTGPGAGRAAAHLAKANAVATRCGHLTDQLREELSGYAGMAEVVVAGQLGSDQVTRVMDEARKQAGGMTCGVETEDLALSAIEAAREAMNQAGDASPAMRSTIAEVPAIQVEEEAATRGCCFHSRSTPRSRRNLQ